MNTHIIFVAPFCMETTLRFVNGAASLPGVNLSLISQEGVEKLPPDLRARLAAHWRVENALDPQQLVVAARALETKLGPAKRMIGALEQLQVPLAKARETLGIDGLGAEAARNFRDKSRMKDVLHQAGLPCARHVLAESLQQAQAFAAKDRVPAGGQTACRRWRKGHLPSRFGTGPAYAAAPLPALRTSSRSCWRSSSPAPSTRSTAS